MKRPLIVLFACLAGLAVAFPVLTPIISGVVFIKPEAPTGTTIPLATQLKPENSQLVIEAQFPLTDLQKLIEREVPTDFEGQKKQNLTSLLSDSWISWDIQRGNVSLALEESRLLLGTPLTGEVKAGGNVFGSFPIRGTVDLRAGVIGALSPNLTEDWTLKPNAAVNLNLQNANIKLGNAGSFDISSFLKTAIAQEIAKLLRELEPALNREEGWKRSLNEIWIDLHRVEKINSDPEMWITIKPSGIAMRPLDYSDETQICGVFRIDVEIVAHLSRPEAPAPAPLAPLMTDPNLSTKSQLRVPTVLPLDRINHELMKQVIEFEIAEADVQLTKLELEVHSAEEIHVKTDFTASRGLMNRRLEGNLWLKGKPMIDLATQQLAFADLEFTMETQNTLEKSAVWLLKPGLRNELDRALRFDISKELGKATQSANQALRDFERPQGLEGEVKIDDLAVEDVYLIRTQTAEDALVVVLAAEAAATLKVGMIELDSSVLK